MPEKITVETLSHPPKSPGGGKKKAAAGPAPAAGPPTPRTVIANRIQAALKDYPPSKNRSSDLVPLTREFEALRRKYKALNAKVKAYPVAISHAEEARMELVSSFASLAEGSPIDGQIGGSGDNSMKSVTNQLVEQNKQHGEKFMHTIARYCEDWESYVTSTVDAQLTENKKLHEHFNHYQQKVEVLRKKEEAEADKLQKKEEKKAEAAAAASPNQKASPVAPPKRPTTKLAEKLERNESKLNSAWKTYENSSAALCNLMEEVMKQGWQDLYPLVVETIQWEIRRTSAKFELTTKYGATQAKMETAVEAATKKRNNELAELRQALHGMSHSADSSSSAGSSASTEQA